MDIVKIDVKLHLINEKSLKSEMEVKKNTGENNVF
jgi:hypothetical protein